MNSNFTHSKTKLNANHSWSAYVLDSSLSLTWILSVSMCLGLSIGCDDSNSLPPSQDMMSLSVDLMLPNSDLSPMDMNIDQNSTPLTDAMPPLPPAKTKAGWLILNIQNPLAFYALNAQIVATIDAFDQQGEPLDEIQIDWESTPEGIEFETNGNDRSTQAQQTLTLNTSGIFEIVACLKETNTLTFDMPICVNRQIVVDQGPPTLDIIWPSRGRMLHADSLFDLDETLYQEISMYFNSETSVLPELNTPIGQTIPVIGRVSDDQSQSYLTFLNGTIIDNQQGYWIGEVDARSGYNSIEVEADDGVQYKMARDHRSILWVPRYTEIESRSSFIPRGALLQMNQSFIDDNQPINSAESPWVINELAQLIELLFSLADPNTLLSSLELADQNGFQFSILNVDLGTPYVDLTLTSDGLSLYLALNELVLQTQGNLELSGTSVNLDGQLTLGVSTFADFQLDTSPDQALILTLDTSSVSINQLQSQL
jgi:hypothetical protein